MALDSFFTSNIELNVALASQAWYTGNGPLPVNPYQEGTEQWRAWRRARSDAAIAESMRGQTVLSTHQDCNWRE